MPRDIREPGPSSGAMAAGVDPGNRGRDMGKRDFRRVSPPWTACLRSFRGFTRRKARQARRYKTLEMPGPRAAESLPPPRLLISPPDLADVLQHGLLRLVGQRQGGHRDRLAGCLRLPAVHVRTGVVLPT